MENNNDKDIKSLTKQEIKTRWQELAARLVHRRGFRAQYSLDELKQKFIEYVDFCSNKRSVYQQKSKQKSGVNGREVQAERIENVAPMTEWSFCLWIGKSASWLINTIKYYREIENPAPDQREYLEFLEQLKTFLNSQLLEGAIVGEYTPIVVASLLGLKKNVDVTSNGQTTAAVPIINILPDTKTREEYQAEISSAPVTEDDADIPYAEQI